MRKTITLALLLLSLALLLAACGQKPAENGGTQGSGEFTQPTTEQPTAQPPEQASDGTLLDRIKASGQLRLGTSADYPPYEFHKLVNGQDQIIGFDIEIAKAIAADLGVELVITDMSFEGLLTALQSGSVDMVTAGMTPTPERAQAVDFSDVYYTAVQKIIVRAEDQGTYKAAADLAGKQVGAQQGAIQEGVVTKQLPDATPRLLPRLPDLILDLKAGNIEALVVEEPVAKAYIGSNPELVISDIQLAQDEAGSAIALPKGSPELVEAINGTLQRLAQDGSIDKFVTDATNAMDSQ